MGQRFGATPFQGRRSPSQIGEGTQVILSLTIWALSAPTTQLPPHHGTVDRSGAHDPSDTISCLQSGHVHSYLPELCSGSSVRMDVQLLAQYLSHSRTQYVLGLLFS